MPKAIPTTHPHRIAVWYGKGGVGKSTTTMLLALLLAQRGRQVLVIDLDPECGTSRDFLGAALPKIDSNLKTLLSAPVPLPPTLLPSGIDHLDILPCPADEQRFFRHFPEHSTLLRDAIDLLPAEHGTILFDVPNQYDNIAELGLIAADHVLLPVELTADCCERVPTVLRILDEARALNPALHVLGALALGAVPRSNQPGKLSAKERLILREYQRVFGEAGIRLFDTVMFRSATTVEEARSNADFRLLHWTARRRFQRLLSEIHCRIRASSLVRSPTPHGRLSLERPQQNRATAPVHA